MPSIATLAMHSSIDRHSTTTYDRLKCDSTVTISVSCSYRVSGLFDETSGSREGPAKVFLNLDDLGFRREVRDVDGPEISRVYLKFLYFFCSSGAIFPVRTLSCFMTSA